MQKVLVLTNMYPLRSRPYYGIFVREQVAALRDLGWHVDVFFINSVKCKTSYFSCLPSLARTLRREKYDIIHAHHTYCVYVLAAARFALRHFPKIVFTFHEGEILRIDSLKARNLGENLRYSMLLKKQAVKLADLVVPVSERIKTKLGLASSAPVVSCGVDTSKFYAIPQEEAQAKLNLPHGMKFVFSPSDPKRSADKGTQLLAKVSELMAKNRNQVSFLTGGSIAFSDMPFYYCASDAVIQTSAYEASPTVIKEALACGRPLVTTDVGDVRAVVGDTEGCFVCSSNPEEICDGLIKALSFAGTDGRARIFSLGLDMKSATMKLIQIYKCLLDGGPLQ
jgi:glycosyltransferase involved in cell wall biosynthesis